MAYLPELHCCCVCGAGLGADNGDGICCACDFSEGIMTAEQLARKFHETYERLAPEHGYETRKESARPWSEVPAKNKALMVAVCAEILEDLGLAADLPRPG
jgi:uncharacterized Zn finger protein (UPF0148 family)